jgi:hypothetical protein
LMWPVAGVEAIKIFIWSSRSMLSGARCGRHARGASGRSARTNKLAGRCYTAASGRREKATAAIFDRRHVSVAERRSTPMRPRPVSMKMRGVDHRGPLGWVPSSSDSQVATSQVLMLSGCETYLVRTAAGVLAATDGKNQTTA